MIHIETVDLTLRNVTLPSDRVGMVIAQPYLSLTAAEPYQCTPQVKPQQLSVLPDTLAVARAARHGAPKTCFTVFPEYSIPGLEGIELVENALRDSDWPNGTIVIGVLLGCDFHCAYCQNWVTARRCVKRRRRHPSSN